MPPPNTERRKAIADAAIEILGTRGRHGLTHRTVDRHADLPPGTTSNYFRSREALLQAAAERVAALHEHDVAQANSQAPLPAGRGTVAELLAASLQYSATAHRTRYRAVFELMFEGDSSPELRGTLARLAETMVDVTVRQHRALGLSTTREQVQTVITAYQGILFTLVVGPHAQADAAQIRRLALLLAAEFPDHGGDAPG